MTASYRILVTTRTRCAFCNWTGGRARGMRTRRRSFNDTCALICIFKRRGGNGIRWEEPLALHSSPLRTYSGYSTNSFFFFKENGGVTRWRHPSRSNNSLRATLFSSIHEEEEDFFTTPPGFAPLIKGKYFFPLRWMQSIEKWHPGVKKHGDGVSKKKRIFFSFGQANYRLAERECRKRATIFALTCWFLFWVLCD